MSQALQFLCVEDVLRIHRRMIDEFGGSPTLRDPGLLESAVMMPAARMGGEYLHNSAPVMAAAYLFHLCKNHPFLDGNKRTSLATAEIFLLLNGLRLDASNKEVEALTRGVAEGRATKDEVTEFFHRHVVEGGA